MDYNGGEDAFYTSSFFFAFSRSFYHRKADMKRETEYQTKLMRKIRLLIPGCVVLKNDPRHTQGFPDLLILYKDMWAILEVKRSRNATIQPNQNYYVQSLGAMSFASFIYPENEEEVLSDLQRAFGIKREARIS
jgi:hypothetical protein